VRIKKGGQAGECQTFTSMTQSCDESRCRSGSAEIPAGAEISSQGLASISIATAGAAPEVSRFAAAAQTNSLRYPYRGENGRGRAHARYRMRGFKTCAIIHQPSLNMVRRPCRACLKRSYATLYGSVQACRLPVGAAHDS